MDSGDDAAVKILTDCELGVCSCTCVCGCGKVPSISNRNRYELGHVKGRHVPRLEGHACGNRGRKFDVEWLRNMSESRIRSGRSFGKNNPNYKGGSTNLSARIMHTVEYKAWRRAVYERDGYKCVLCGADRNLQADHIVPRSKIMRDYAISTVDQAIACVALWDVSNGRTLCVPCHRETPTYGWRVWNYLRAQKQEVMPS